LTKAFQYKEDELGMLRAKIEELTKDNYKFKDIVDNKSKGHTEQSREISNLRVEISKLNEEMKFKDKEVEGIEQSKIDMTSIITKISNERDKY
jgi:predicted nuclease with TOPRIM domain